MNTKVLNKLTGKLIVSCQGYDERTFHSADDMLAMANAAAIGGCVGFRVNSPEYIKCIKNKFPEYPIIGIWKKEIEGVDVYITPDVESVLELKTAGADIIALDSTNRTNYLGEYGWQTIEKVRKIDQDILLMADVATFEEAKKAVEAGANIISTTMSGYTPETSHKNLNPDYELVKKCKENLSAFIICEGRIWTREDAYQAFEAGADAVVVGTAITNPKWITERFVQFLKEKQIWH